MVHVGLFSLFALTRTPTPIVTPVIEVELVRPIVPPPPPPPPPPEPPAPVSGGGAPAAPSVVHTPPKPRPVPPELPAPPVKAPEPALVIGIAPIASPAPGFGQGGQGTGTGSGSGAGDGPGSGGSPPRFIRGPSSTQILRVATPAARRARINATVPLRCRIRLDTRLEACRVLDEPAGLGLGQAAVAVAQDTFRFAPPSRDGRPVDGAEMTVFVQFNLSGRRGDDNPPVG